MELKVLFFVAIVLIVGLLFGKIAKAVKMPNVTGYLVGGLVLGPSVFGLIFGDGLISTEAIEALGIVSNVALGFIAFSIGSELKLSYFKRVGPGPIIIATLESLFAILFVLGLRRRIRKIPQRRDGGLGSVASLRRHLRTKGIRHASAPRRSRREPLRGHL